jgi:hypothetical protein
MNPTLSLRDKGGGIRHPATFSDILLFGCGAGAGAAAGAGDVGLHEV